MDQHLLMSESSNLFIGRIGWMLNCITAGLIYSLVQASIMTFPQHDIPPSWIIIFPGLCFVKQAMHISGPTIHWIDFKLCRNIHYGPPQVWSTCDHTPLSQDTWSKGISRCANHLVCHKYPMPCPRMVDIEGFPGCSNDKVKLVSFSVAFDWGQMRHICIIKLCHNSFS